MYLIYFSFSHALWLDIFVLIVWLSLSLSYLFLMNYWKGHIICHTMRYRRTKNNYMKRLIWVMKRTRCIWTHNINTFNIYSDVYVCFHFAKVSLFFAWIIVTYYKRVNLNILANISIQHIILISHNILIFGTQFAINKLCSWVKLNSKCFFISFLHGVIKTLLDEKS